MSSGLNEYLDNDGLREVLGHLALRDKIRCERVCRRWHTVMPYNTHTHFELAQLVWPCRHVHDLTYTTNHLTYTQRVMSNKRFARYLYFVLCRIGHSVRVLKLADTNHFRVLITREVLQLLIDWAPCLRVLHLGGAVVHIQALQLLNQLEHLVSVNLASCHFLNEQDNQAPANYDQLSETVDGLLGQGHVTDCNLQQFPGIPTIRGAHITSLKLNNVATLSNDLLDDICKQCPRLNGLSVGDCRNLNLLKPVAALTDLRVLAVNGTKIIDTDLELICRSCLRLEKLRIDNCPQLSSFACLRNLQLLESLWLGPAANFGDGELGRVSRHGKLKDVAISFCRVSDIGLRYLASHCPQLTQIHACGTHITDEGVQCLVSDCAQLESMNIQSSAVTDLSLAHIGRFALSLQLCFIQNCRYVCDHGFSSLLYERTRRLQKGVQLKPLLIMAGGEQGQPISDTVVSQLTQVGVIVDVKRPVLALAFSV